MKVLSFMFLQRKDIMRFVVKCGVEIDLAVEYFRGMLREYFVNMLLVYIRIVKLQIEKKLKDSIICGIIAQ